MLVQPLGVAVNIARVAGHTAIAALRGTAVRELILDTATGCCIRVDLRPMRRPCCCCATLCMATELSLTQLSLDGIFALASSEVPRKLKVPNFGGRRLN